MLLKRISLTFICLVVLLLFWGLKPTEAITISPPRFDEIVFTPGQEINEKIIVYNESSVQRVFIFEVQNFEAADESGSPKFLEDQTGLASWITVLKDQIVVAPDEVTEVPFKISVPAGAPPGGYYAAIFLVSGTKEEIESRQVSQQFKVGTLLLGQVPGEVEEKVALKEFKINSGDKNFFSLRPKGFSTLFENIGTVHSRPEVKVLITNGNWTKDAVDLNPGGGYILPGSVRKFESRWRISEPTGFWSKLKIEIKEFTFGRYKASLLLDDKIDLNTENYLTFWVIPWHLLLVVVFLIIILITLVKVFRKIVIRKASKNY